MPFFPLLHWLFQFQDQLWSSGAQGIIVSQEYPSRVLLLPCCWWTATAET